MRGLLRPALEGYCIRSENSCVAMGPIKGSKNVARATERLFEHNLDVSQPIQIRIFHKIGLHDNFLYQQRAQIARFWRRALLE